MSGGFFRGTSAEQDTRFSNKQAKLLKSQKFAPELEHLVDMTKVKMDVMRPWIANRVTELLGFEDEVLINFIYGLLDAKEVNGKEVQISLTGFMEKNTAKFMKELWALLLSAQKNASGVPQQFLDAKEEETRKKKAETDRIASEIQRKKDKEARELEQEKLKKMDGEVNRDDNASIRPSSKDELKGSIPRLADEKESNERINSRERSRVSRSPHSTRLSPSFHRGTPSRSISRSPAKSRSSSEDTRSRSISRSPQPRGRSTSSERVHRYPPRRSVSPRRRRSPRCSITPPRHRRRSTSRSHRRSLTPVRRRLRSPMRGRSRSPIRRRSRSPVWRRSRSLKRYRSRSPVRYRSRSPFRPRSRSPVPRRSRTPIRRRSPSIVQRRSPSLERRGSSSIRRHYRRSPSTPRQKSASPAGRRSPIAVHKRSRTPSRRKSPSSQEWSSQSPVHRRSFSPISRKSLKQRKLPVQSHRERLRDYDKYSPVRDASSRKMVGCPVEPRKESDSLERLHSVSLRSPKRDSKDLNDSHGKRPNFPCSPDKSPRVSESPPVARITPSEDRSSSPYGSPVKHSKEYMIRAVSPSPPRRPREHKSHLDSPETSIKVEESNYVREDGDQKINSFGKGSSHSSMGDDGKNLLEKLPHKDKNLPKKLASRISAETRSQMNFVVSRKKDQETYRENISARVLHPEASDQEELPSTYKGTLPSERRQESSAQDGHKPVENVSVHSQEAMDGDRGRKSETFSKFSRKVEQKVQSGSVDSLSEDSDKQLRERRKHGRSRKQEMTSDDDYSYDSQVEERKKAKRRRKEEKKLRREERRQRREERHRRREERRAEKRKAKSRDAASPISDLERNHDEHFARGESHANDVEETESEKKRLEIELRERALKSLKAKKGIDL